MTLRRKWSLLVMTLVSLPLLFLAVRSLNVFRTGLEGSEKALEAIVAAQVASGVESRFEQAKATASRIGRLVGDAEVPRDARLSWVQDLLASEPLVERIGLYGTDRQLIDEVKQVQSAGAPEQAGPMPQELPALPDERSQWLPVNLQLKSPEFRFIAPVAKGGEVHGWVLARLAPDALEEAVHAVTEGTFDGPDDTVLVLSSDNKKLAGTGDLALAQAFLERLGPEAKGALTARSDMDIAGRIVNGSAMPFGPGAFRLVIVRPEERAFPMLGKARRELQIACVVLLAFALASALWLADRTTKPISALVQLTQQYAKREFAARSPVRTGDELQTLGDSMSTMADALSAGEREIARRAQVEAGLSRYLPEEVARAVALGKGKLELGGQRREVTVLFADVVAFTSFSEKASPETVVAFLNELFGLLSEIVFRHAGIVDKFMGDSIMAVFGATDAALGQELEPAGSSARAVACAEDMHRFVDAIHQEWEKKYDFSVRLGVGVSSGPAVVGNLGSEKRMEFTAIGDAVNVAARLESMARPGQTLVTGAVVLSCADAFAFQSLGAHALRGKSEKTELFELKVDT
jgi:adenylate cyclase